MAKRVRIDVDVDSKKGVQSISKVDNSVKKLEKSTSRSSKAMLKNFAGMAAASAGAAISIQQIVSKTTLAVKEFASWENQILRLESQIKSTGRLGQTTASELEKMAQSIDKATLQSTKGVRNAQGILMSFGNISTDMFERILYIASDVSEVMGQDLASAAKQMALALEDPQRGLSMLRRTGTTFTESQQNMIKSLYKSGKVMEAQTAILKVMEKQYGGSAKAAAEGLAGSLDLLGRNTTNLSVKVGEHLSPVIKQSAEDMAVFTESLTDAKGLGYAISYIVDTISILSRTVELAGKTIAVIFAGINREAWRLAETFVNGPIKALQLMVDLYNKIPKLDKIELPEGLSNFSKAISDGMKMAEYTVDHGVQNIRDLLNRPLPGNLIRDNLNGTKEAADKLNKSTENLGNKTKTLEEINKDYANSLKDILIGYQNLDVINLTDKEQRMMVNEDDYNKAKSLMDKWNQDKKDQIALTKEMNDFINENTLSTYELERQELQRNYEKFSEVQGNKIALLQAYGTALKEINDREDEEYKRKLASDAERVKTTFQKWQESAQTTSDLITEVVLKASDAIASGMTNALYDFIDGTKSAQDAFKDFARDFLSQITKMIIQQQILNALKTSSGFFGGMLGFADGGTVPGGFKAFASGGTVTKPTLGLVGEGSMNEAIVPLPNGKSIPVDLKNNNNKAPNVKIEVINNGNNVEATQTTPKFDGQQWVIGVVLDAINNNVGFKNQIKGAVTS